MNVAFGLKNFAYRCSIGRRHDLTVTSSARNSVAVDAMDATSTAMESSAAVPSLVDVLSGPKQDRLPVVQFLLQHDVSSDLSDY